MTSKNIVDEFDIVISEELDRYRVPVLLYDVEKLSTNMNLLAQSMSDPGAVQLAVKSFPHPRVIQLADQCGLSFEVSNKSEYDLLPNNLTGRIVALNNPLGATFGGFTDRGNDLHVNVEQLSDLPQDTRHSGCIYGLRLDHKQFPIDSELLIGSEVRGRFGRFGAAWSAFLNSAPLFKQGRLGGIHFHNGSESNTADFYRASVAKIAETLEELDIRPQYLSVGGGFHTLADEEITPLLIELQRVASNIRLYIEPGNIISRKTGYLLCRVGSVREFESRCYYVTLDSSYDCHTKWSMPSWAGVEHFRAAKLPYKEIPEPLPGAKVIVFGGASCHNNDRLGIFKIDDDGNDLPIKPNDPIILSNINGYSWAWNNSFNGIPRARIRFFN